MVSSSAPRPQKTFANQDKLPRLPIPDLDKSLDRYVRSLIPLIEQKVSYKASTAEAFPHYQKLRSG
jgi:carnitine O-acetyltransferase